MALLKGIGVHDFYTSLGENGIWTGGYFVPERTFCAIPSKDHQAYHLFSRRIIKNVDDEVQAHMSMFIRDKNDEYEQMTQEASNLVIRWFNDDSDIVDDPKLAEAQPEPVEQPVTTTKDGQEIPKTDGLVDNEKSSPAALVGDDDDDSDLPDESPLDITAAAAAVPLPDDNVEVPPVANTRGTKKSHYMRYLMEVAQQAGTDVKSYVPTKMPEMPSGPSFKSFVPNMPQMPSIPMPTVGMFSRKKQHDVSDADELAKKETEGSNADAAASGPKESSSEQLDTQNPRDSDTLGPQPHQDSEAQKSPDLTALNETMVKDACSG
jgi:hypothetical protein